MRTCVHYASPVHCNDCLKGINYLELAGGERCGYLARLPCVTTQLSRDQVKCEHFKAYTPKQAEDEYKKFEELFNQQYWNRKREK